MKMKYLPNKEYENKNKFISFILIFLILIISFVWRESVQSFLFDSITYVSKPLWGINNYISDEISAFFINFDNKESLVLENDKLTKQLGLLRVYALENKILKEENLGLKNILTINDSSQFVGTGSGSDKSKNLKEKNKKTTETREINITPAFVLSGPVTPPYDVILVDSGKNKSVKVGDIAIDSMGSMVGEVVEIYSETSKIRLFSSYGLKTSIIFGQSKTMIDIIGSGSGNFYVSMPSQYTVGVGDYALFPGNIVSTVAIVAVIEKKEGDAFKKIFLKAPFNIKEIRFVEIIRKEKE
ncbi:MAG: rod shape-determining protein MreC [bacterium]